MTNLEIEVRMFDLYMDIPVLILSKHKYYTKMVNITIKLAKSVNYNIQLTQKK